MDLQTSALLQRKLLRDTDTTAGFHLTCGWQSAEAFIGNCTEKQEQRKLTSSSYIFKVLSVED